MADISFSIRLFYLMVEDDSQTSSNIKRFECRLGLVQLLQQGHPGLGKLFMVLRVFTQVIFVWPLFRLIRASYEQSMGVLTETYCQMMNITSETS